MREGGRGKEIESLHNDITPQRALFKTDALYFGEAEVGKYAGWMVVSHGSSLQALNELNSSIA